jgi:hypothetical protein
MRRPAGCAIISFATPSLNENARRASAGRE